MQRCFMLGLLACLTAGSCSRSPTDEGSSSDNATQAAVAAQGASSGDFVIGEPIRHKNLTVFPVVSKTPRNEDRYLTLDEGLKAGTVQITEVGTGGNVNRGRQSNEPRLPLEDPFGGPGPVANPAPGDTAPPPLTPPSPPLPPSPSDPGIPTIAMPAPNTNQPAEEPKPLAPIPSAPAAPAAPADPFGTPAPAASAAPADPFGAPLPPMPNPNNGDEATPPPQQSIPAQIDDPFGAGGPDVNRLVVVNRSGKPLYLMPGEIIYGGQQDRTIAEETIILADAKPVTINVYCVEQGRWAHRDEARTAAALSLLADPTEAAPNEEVAQKLAAEAKQGKFVAPAGSLSKGARLAVQDAKGQHEVWNAVGQANAASGVMTESDAFTANYTSPEILKQLQQYVDSLQSPIVKQSQVVGVIVAVNGKVQTVDVFQSTPLFQKLWPKLLKSHALDAIAAAQAKDAEKLCTIGDAKEFLDGAMQADVERKTDSQGGLVVTKRDSPQAVLFSLSDTDDAAPAGKAGFGGAVHSAGYSK